MISDNIRYYRKANHMSQDELAEKLGVSRQSVSLWENGQTQPTIDNIIALAKIFNTTADAILSSEPVGEGAESAQPPQEQTPGGNGKNKLWLILAIAAAAAVIIGAVYFGVFRKGPAQTPSGSTEISEQPRASSGIPSQALPTDDPLLAGKPQGDPSGSGSEEDNPSGAPSEGLPAQSTAPEVSPPPAQSSAPEASPPPAQSAAPEASPPPAQSAAPEVSPPPAQSTAPEASLPPAQSTAPEVSPPPAQSAAPASAAPQPFDLFAYCKDFAIEIGNLRGDYCIYQQPATRYGGYEDEYFSISYWADSDMVEFCLHCPLDETLSINFYLRMRGGYDGKYEYLSSKYYRDTGVSLRYATGYLDPAVFSDAYPLSCDKYEGSSEGQTEFMEESRVGMCDLIYCLKKFVAAEGMACSFADFDFVNF